MQTKKFTHSIALPPNTDVQELLGSYKGLFGVLGIQNNFPFISTEGFTHPIKECNDKLTQEFMSSMTLLKTQSESRGPISCEDARIGNSQVTFVFSYTE